MKRHLILAGLLVVFSFLGLGSAGAVEGYRGSTWGELRWDFPKKYDSNLLLSGWIKQGIDWKRWGENTTLNTYATVRYKADTEQLDWNNTLEPGIGVAIETFTSKGLVGTFALEYLWEKRLTKSGLYDQKLVIYIGWYGWWDLKK